MKRRFWSVWLKIFLLPQPPINFHAKSCWFEYLLWVGYFFLQLIYWNESYELCNGILMALIKRTAALDNDQLAAARHDRSLNWIENTIIQFDTAFLVTSKCMYKNFSHVFSLHSFFNPYSLRIFLMLKHRLETVKRHVVGRSRASQLLGDFLWQGVPKVWKLCF